jgi:hypothetical protein
MYKTLIINSLVLFLATAMCAQNQLPGHWEQKPGAAKDIAIGGDGSVWVIGTNVEYGGFGIHKWNGTGWSAIDGGAMRIAVDRNGNPWVVNSLGNIFRREGGTWIQTLGAAKDIAIGFDGSVWVIGTNVENGGFGIYKWNGNGWDGVDGGAVRISVDGDGQPWVMNSNGDVFRRKNGAWSSMGSNVASGLAEGIPITYFSKRAEYGGFSMRSFTMYLQDLPYNIDGAAVAGAKGNNGQFWCINSLGNIFERKP